MQVDLFSNGGLAEAREYVNIAYYVGFFGYYVGLVPGMIFDKKGPLLTLLYGYFNAVHDFIFYFLLNEQNMKLNSSFCDKAGY